MRQAVPAGRPRRHARVLSDLDWLSLRGRLLLLVIVGLVPPFLVLGWALHEGAAARLGAAEREVAAEAALRAERQGALIARTGIALLAFARHPAIRDAARDPASCRTAARDTASDMPWLRDVGVTDAAGEVVCTSSGGDLGLSLADAAHLREASATARPAAAGLIRSRHGVAEIAVAVPIREGAAGAVDRIVLGTVAVDRLLDPGPIAPAAGGAVHLLDGAGRLVASAPAVPERHGLGDVGHPLLAAIRGGPEFGALRVTGLRDGDPRIIGFARIPGTDALVLVSRAEADLLAPHARRASLAALAALAGLLAVAALAWWFGRAMLVDDLRRLAAAAARPGATDSAGDGTEGRVFGALRLGPSAAREVRTLHAALAAMEERQSASLGRARARARLLKIVTGSMAQGLAAWGSDGRLLFVSRPWRSMLGLNDSTIRRGCHFLEAARHLAERGIYGPGEPEALAQQRFVEAWGGEGGAAARELVAPGGRVLAVADRALPGGGLVTTLTDITERRRAEERATHLARHDDLTGLPNRLMLQERLAELLVRARCGGEGGSLALLHIDLSRFQWVNDTLGHAVGDVVLGQVAERIRARVRARRDGGDLVARIGGDEFAVVTRPAFGLEVDAAQRAVAIAGRLIAALSEPFEAAGHRIVLGASIGIALHPADGDAPGDLLPRADLALRRAKREGGGRFRFFEATMDAEAQARLMLDLDLRHAIAEAPQQLSVHFQPSVEIATRRVTGFEALIRWHHPVRGQVPPASFVALAEENGLVEALGEFALRRACAEAVRWPDPSLRVAVNISPLHFQRGCLADTVGRILEETGLAPHRLEIEVTEGVLLRGSKEVLAILATLRRLGVRVAVDDFGTGYSSLSYLRRYAFDKVKIDQAFVRELAQRPDDQEIVRAVATLCAGLGMTSTAEGVETEAQLRMLEALNCREAQGYLFSRPVPAEAIPALLARLRSEAGAVSD